MIFKVSFSVFTTMIKELLLDGLPEIFWGGVSDVTNNHVFQHIFEEKKSSFVSHINKEIIANYWQLKKGTGQTFPLEVIPV